jgi:hypothetical protein
MYFCRFNDVSTGCYRVAGVHVHEKTHSIQR